jgi:hypothetical protein
MILEKLVPKAPGIISWVEKSYSLGLSAAAFLPAI